MALHKITYLIKNSINQGDIIINPTIELQEKHTFNTDIKEF